MPNLQNNTPALRVTPLGDQAILVYCDDEAAAGRLASSAQAQKPVWVTDIVTAYASVAVFFDPAQIRYAAASEWLSALPVHQFQPDAARQFTIPCCYELGPDLEDVARQCKLSPDDVIGLHTQQEYVVYAIGFCPGFPYLGYLPAELTGVPRRAAPRIRVEAGSVGLTGRQTGIYPLERPGGWPLIGRTPMTLVDLAAGYFALAPGDRVRFEAISKSQHGKLIGTRPSPKSIGDTDLTIVHNL